MTDQGEPVNDRLSFEDSEAILAGRATDPDGRELARALAGLRQAVVTPIPSHVAARHLAAMAAVDGAEVGGRGHLGEVLRGVGAGFRLPAVRWAGVGAVGLIGFVLGLATADRLPDPAQRFVSRTAARVGIELPDGEPAADEPVAPTNEPGGAGSPARSPATAGGRDDAPTTGVTQTPGRGGGHGSESSGPGDGSGPGGGTANTPSSGGSGQSDDDHGNGSSTSGPSSSTSAPDDDGGEDADDEADAEANSSNGRGNSGSGSSGSGSGRKKDPDD